MNSSTSKAIRRPRVPQAIKDAHQPTLHRKRLGTTWNGKASYGNDVSCACGWRVNTNESARDAIQHHRDHLVDVLEESRAAVIDGVLARIPICARDGSVRAYALVDAEYVAKLAETRWGLSTDGYAISRTPANEAGVRQALALHRVILGLTPGDGLDGDHINGDRLDCRRSNLRITTRAGNAQNKPSYGGTSRYRGVSWSKRHRKWKAAVRLDGRAHTIGYFADEIAAADAASAWRVAHMPHTNETRRVAGGDQ